jgi:anti-sigma regulatory factor (Ser/Thr protein kinase)
MKELTLPASRTKIPEIIEFVNRELERMDCGTKTRAQIDIAIDELYSNIAKYGFDDDGGEVTVTLETASEPRVVSISFMDGGRPFNPLERSDPDITLSARDRKIGGLGIFMVKKSMDDVRYEYREGKNILTIRKIL